MNVMYQALYRKYRPSTFDEVVGQDVIVKTLKNAIINNKLSHAYLFAGPRGTGKTSIAKIFAKTINCLEPINGNPCNECVNCTQIIKKQTTDIIEIDAASNNGVDEIRELRSKANLVPSNSEYKVYIIDEVHMLSTGAFNALLKTLEEPPSHVIFILATTEPHKVIQTILSRCQRFDFKKIEDKKIIECLKNISLKENVDIDLDALKEIARLSDGAMRDAIGMLDQAHSYVEGQITLKEIHEINGTISNYDIKEFIKDIEENNIDSLFKKIDDFNDSGKNLIKISEQILLFLRDLLLYKTVTNYFETKEILYGDFDNLPSDQILDIITELNNTITQMKYVDNPKITFELFIIKLTSIKEPKYIEKPKEIKKDTTTEIKEVVEEVLEPEPIEEPSKENPELDKIIDIRVNNTLATFKKALIPKVKKELENLNSMLLLPEVSNYVSLILDGDLRATGEQYLLFVYNSEHMATIFNQNIVEIEEILAKTLSTTYKVIAVDKNHWDEIKKEYNSKEKEYTLKEEKFNLEKVLDSVPKDDIENLFGNLIEYEEEKI